jgi:TonB-dependent receptor
MSALVFRIRALSHLLTVAACLLAVSFPLMLPAQTSAGAGSLAGEVSDKNTGALLDAALVELPVLNRRAHTDNTGAYSFIGLPAGEHEVVVSYAGLDTERRRVTVAAGQWTRANFDLGTEVLKLEAFKVVGEREGNAAAIAQQHKADNLVNIVATDAFGNIADGNIGNFLQFLPGIAALSSDGEITGITLRGAPPGMNLVSLDGTTITDGNDNRAPNMGSIPSELVKQVEVTKAITPNLDADAIGGSVNMVTRSGFDYKTAYLNYRAAFTNNTFRDGNPWSPLYTITAMDTCLNRKLGVSLVGSYSNTLNARDRIQMRHPGDDGHKSVARLLDDPTERTRVGANLKLEYRFNRAASVYLNTSYTYTKSDTERVNYYVGVSQSVENNVADYGYTFPNGTVADRAYIERGNAARTSTGAVAPIAPGATETYTELLNAIHQIQLSYFDTTRRQYFLDFGGRKAWGEFELKGKATYNPSRTRGRSLTPTLVRSSGFGYAIATGPVPDGVTVPEGVDVSAAAPDNPVFWETYGGTIHAGADMSKYELTHLSNPNNVDNDAATAQLDIKRAFSRWKMPFVFSAGAKWRWQNYITDSANTLRWYYAGPDKVRNSGDENLGQFINGKGYAVFDGKYPAFDKMDIDEVLATFDRHRDYFVNSGATNDIRGVPPSEIVENVYSGYLMARGTLAPGLIAIAGLRMEATDLEGTGAYKRSDSADYTTTTKDGSYEKFFPSFHLRYNLTSNLQFRAAYTTAIARPSLSRVVPTTTVTIGDSGSVTVRQNNPNLQPQFSQNYDLMVEYYLKPSGVLSAGWFYKDIKDFLMQERRTIGFGPGNGFNGEYEGGTLLTDINLGGATIEGYELNYQQRLTFLPKPFNTLSAFVNYTHLKTEGTYNNGATDLVNFIPKTLSAGLNWQYRRLRMGVTYNYKSDYLSYLGSTPVDTIRMTGNGTWDANVSYTVRNSWLAVYCSVVNIGNDWPDGYATNKNWLDIIEVYGTRLTFGISGRF